MKLYTIKIPVQIDFAGNKMSMETKSIKLSFEAENTKQALSKLENVLSKLLIEDEPNV